MTPRQESLSVASTSGGWSQVAGLYDTRWWWTSGQSAKVWSWDAAAGTSTLAFDLKARLGSRFTVSLPGAGCVDGTVWELSANDLHVETAVGRFEHCVQLSMVQPICRSQPVQELIFAPDVGIVRYTRKIGVVGPEVWDLSGAMVGGVEYKRMLKGDPGLSVGLSMDRFTYRSGDTAKARFEIRNGTPEPVSFDLASGQDFDFQLRDWRGATLWTWSANKRFAQMLQTKVLAPGQSFAFDEGIALRSLSGAALSPGDYVLEAVHTTTPSETRARATTSFRVAR